MRVKQFVFNHFQTNSYLLWDDLTRNCALVDPCAEAGYEEGLLTGFVEENNLKPVRILLTHAHVDHIAGLRQMSERYQLPVTLHADGVVLLRQAAVYGDMMGFCVKNMDDLPTSLINENDVLEVGGHEQSDKRFQGQIECRHVPGHCPGSMAFVLHSEKMVITGDALFRGSIGRTDLPGGDYPLLMESLHNRILSLPDEYQVLPGHGESTTIGEERLYNGFLI